VFDTHNGNPTLKPLRILGLFTNEELDICCPSSPLRKLCSCLHKSHCFNLQLARNSGDLPNLSDIGGITLPLRVGTSSCSASPLYSRIQGRKLLKTSKIPGNELGLPLQSTIYGITRNRCFRHQQRNPLCVSGSQRCKSAANVCPNEHPTQNMQFLKFELHGGDCSGKRNKGKGH
jgi:hypothetical protein